MQVDMGVSGSILRTWMLYKTVQSSVFKVQRPLPGPETQNPEPETATQVSRHNALCSFSLRVASVTHESLWDQLSNSKLFWLPPCRVPITALAGGDM
jgi:hypothetical protein